jgi:copper chaperone CopZ
MKKQVIQISIMAAFLMSGSQIFASEKTVENSTIIQSDSTLESFKVYGNCGMCKKTIEGSLKDQEGIYSAIWDKETKLIEVNFNEESISLEEIKKKIAKVGYDSEDYRATKKAYSNLAGCCQYERPEEK